jgi:hypothetical protein
MKESGPIQKKEKHLPKHADLARNLNSLSLSLSLSLYTSVKYFSVNNPQTGKTPPSPQGQAAFFFPKAEPMPRETTIFFIEGVNL